MTNITHHPQPQLLQQYADGQLDGGVALLVAAHVEMCPHCRNQVEVHEQQLARQALTASPNEPRLEAMLEGMLEKLPSNDNTIAVAQSSEQQHLQLQHHSFRLPRVLSNQLNKIGGWSAQPGKLHQARLELGDHSLQLIHMDRNTKVPSHTHRGNELTLVLHGGFSDAEGDYKVGDFIALDQRHEHQPYTDADEDCLVISAVDAPLHFTSGLARMLNPLSQLFFKP
ncbi:ChrR family anti-sigma-E factor [Ferrimonas senticii]|uniref:ChrR family anti-sigma-E factor n=1 Tax=Ferrimonas senticii TaxID=394566 RepID=UPI0003F6ABFF|nr:ChrR family anti-sigma-E factor [Ferrimonas senticii]